MVDHLMFKDIRVDFDSYLPPSKQGKICPKCHGIMDYLYGKWFRCRDCGAWKRGW
jgi:hypothetical protein